MSTSPRYDSIAAQLTTALPELRPRLLEPLVCVLVGMSQAVSAHQGRVASAMPLHTKQASKVQRFRRLLDNAKLIAEDIYQPIVRPALAGLRHQRVYLLLDRVVLTPFQNLLVVSVGFRRRSVPLVWRVLDNSGTSTLEAQQAVLTAAAALLPEQVHITVLADSEFRSYTLFDWLRSHNWDAILGIRGKSLVTPDLAQPARLLTTWLPQRDSVAYLSGMYITEDSYGPVNILAWWDKNDRGELLGYGVMTNLPATWRTYRLGSRRMWIETMFRDWQSGGFALGTSGVRDPERFHRLVLLVCLVYLWFVSVGRWLVKRGYRSVIDAGPSDAWQLSLFTLAVAWQDRLRTFHQPMPVFWKVYL